MYLVGLTGGIGSGKSTVAARLATHGCRIVDADAVAREVVEPGEPALAEIAERFGDEVLHPDGSLDRSAMAERVFRDDEARAVLEAVTHPRIAERVDARIAEAGRTGGDGEPPIVVLDHPLLVESGRLDRFDALVVVLADPELRVRRLVQARGLTETDARARMRAQASDEERREVADHVVRNDGGVADLEREVDALYTRLRAAADARAAASDRPGAG